MDQKQELPRLTAQQLSQATALVGRAFHNDPFSVYIYPDEAKRTRRLPLLWSIPLRYTLRYSEVTTTPELTGVACWLPPEHTPMSESLTLSIGDLMALLRMGVAGLRRSGNAEAYMVSTHQHCITEPHWYLWVLGVDPMHQGQGIGGLLLRAGLARADASDLPCYLETMNPANVPLYQKFGFAVENLGTLPDSSVRMWSMIRPARSPRGIS